MAKLIQTKWAIGVLIITNLGHLKNINSVEAHKKLGWKNEAKSSKVCRKFT